LSGAELFGGKIIQSRQELPLKRYPYFGRFVLMIFTACGGFPGLSAAAIFNPAAQAQRINFP